MMAGQEAEALNCTELVPVRCSMSRPSSIAAINLSCLIRF